MTKIMALFGILRTRLNTVHSRNHTELNYRVQVNSVSNYHVSLYMSVPACLKHVEAAVSVIL